MRNDVLPWYSGPRNALAHVSNLFYGENECGTKSLEVNSGSSQFWKFLGTLAYGYNRWISNDMYRDVQKSHNKSYEARLVIKYDVLLALKRKGFWLVDAMVFGWYLQQPVEYQPTKVSKSTEVVKKSKNRPPRALKHSALVLSWELWTQHVVHAAAKCGNLECILPIGRTVGTTLTKERLLDAITVSDKSAVVEINVQAPNSYSLGGYDGTLRRISVDLEKYE